MSFVLLNQEGTVAKKLQLISLPDGYVIPEGMTLSWRTAVECSSRDPLAGFVGPKEPPMAFFYLGSAHALVERGGFTPSNLRDNRFGIRTLTVTVQGTSAKDVNDLRDKIMELIQTSARWGTRNDLNPPPAPTSKPSFWQRILARAS